MDMPKLRRMGYVEERVQNKDLMPCGLKKEILLIKAFELTIKSGRKGRTSFGIREVFVEHFFLMVKN